MSNQSRLLKSGKLPGPLLQELIDSLPTIQPDKRLVVGPGIGEDAAHILFGENTLLAKTDPITFATDRIGWYAMNVNANDIAVAGGTPKWFLATLMMPPGTTEEDVRTIFEQLGEAATDLGVQLAGGHTEVTPAVNQPVMCGFMLGEAPTSKAVTASGARPGDQLILTKGIAIEGTSILANECRQALVEAGVRASDIEAGSKFLGDPGISVVRDAQTVVASGGVTAMHDPTEGGLATALQELAHASNVDIVIDEPTVDVLPVCRTICDALEIDPWGLISSGALLATVQQENSDATVKALEAEGIAANIIGNVNPVGDEDAGPTAFVRGEETAELVTVKEFERDELARYFEELPG